MTHAIEDVTSWPEQEDEQLGSKSKTWLAAPDRTRWLFKEPRPDTGEHWAELIAADIAEAIGVPHAYMRLATRNGVLGTISLDFTQHELDLTKDVTLLHGNQLLASAILDYEREAMRPPDHTVEAVLAYLDDPTLTPPSDMIDLPGIDSAADAFVGYLLLDAVVGNTDRHHENWGVLQIAWQDQVAGSQAYFFGGNMARAFHQKKLELAPSYDHASSLGRDISDELRSQRLSGPDPKMTVESYCARGRTPLYGAVLEQATGSYGKLRQLTYREAFLQARHIRPKAAAAWLSHLASLPVSELVDLVDRVPATVASEPARAFAKAALTCNLAHLLALPR